MTKEDIKQICQIYDNFRSERDVATIAYNSDDTFWEHILATYNLSQPSLPSNLDEAALKELQVYLPQSNGPDGICYFIAAQMLAMYKAGAEWMAEQGVTVECGVRVYPTLDGVAHRWVSLYKNGINIDSLKDIPRLKSLDFKDDDTAIVQIRKK